MSNKCSAAIAFALTAIGMLMAFAPKSAEAQQQGYVVKTNRSKAVDAVKIGKGMPTTGAQVAPASGGTAATSTPTSPSTASTGKNELPKYEIGSGATYKLNVAGSVSDVTVAFVEQNDKTLVLEVHMESKSDPSSLQIEMTQQFHLAMENGQMRIVTGAMKIPHVQKPQILSSEYLRGYSGVQMRSFLFNDEKTFKKKSLIGVETVTGPAGTFKAEHYRVSENGQTVEFWISDQVKPLGLVKMTSTGGAMGMSYTMDLGATVSNVKKRIEYKDAVPLSDEAKMFLPLIGPSMMPF